MRRIKKVKALKDFVTWDASGIVRATAGETLEVHEYTAKRLIEQRLVTVKRERKRASNEDNDNG